MVGGATPGSQVQEKSQVSFRTVLLTYNLVMLFVVLLLAVVLFASLYSIVGDMQTRIQRYITINRLAGELASGKEDFMDLFAAIQESDRQEVGELLKAHRYTQYRALLNANTLNVPYEENPEKYFLANAIINGINYIGALVEDLEQGVAEISPEIFTKYYWGLKVYDYVLDYTYNLYLSAAVSGDVVASLDNMRRVEHLKELSVILMFFIVTAYFATTYLITMWLAKPIGRMVKTAGDITQGNLDTPDLDLAGPQELFFLEKSMNQMKASLKERMELEHRLHRKELEQIRMTRELDRARFLSLQAQINPHFLFNTLNTIGRTALFEHADSTVGLINSLASIFRYTLEFQDDVELSKELEFVRQYLSIQRARFGERISYRIDCPEELEGIRIPPLIIQPFVENAVIHGLEPLEEGGEIVVSVGKVSVRRIRISVEDNGVGIGTGTFPMGDGRGKSHIGIMNVRDRLRVYYKGKAALSISGIGESGGTRVQLVLPCRPVKQESGKATAERQAQGAHHVYIADSGR